MITEEIIEIIQRIILKEVEVGLGIDNILIIVEGMIEVIVCLDVVAEWIVIGLWIHKLQVWNSVLPVGWLCNILGQDANSMLPHPTQV